MSAPSMSSAGHAAGTPGGSRRRPALRSAARAGGQPVARRRGGPVAAGDARGPTEGVRRVLRRAYRDDDGEAGPRAALRRAVRSLSEWRDFATPWRRDPVDRRALVSTAMAAVHAFAPLSGKGAATTNFPSTRHRSGGQSPARGTAARGATGEDALDALEAFLGSLSRDRRSPPAHRLWQHIRDGCAPRRREGPARGAEGVVAGAMAALEGDLGGLPPAGTAAMPGPLRHRQAGAGGARLHRPADAARHLLRRDAAVRGDFQRRYQRLFVDEFQDTDPIQAEICCCWQPTTRTRRLDARAADARQDLHRRRPEAGDLRFRRADVETYWQVKRSCSRTGAEACQLRTCFRSVPTLQRAINHVFAPVMDASAGTAQADYVALEPVRTTATPNPPSWRCRCHGPTGQVRQLRGIEASLPTRSARLSMAGARERLDRLGARAERR